VTQSEEAEKHRQEALGARRNHSDFVFLCRNLIRKVGVIGNLHLELAGEARFIDYMYMWLFTYLGGVR